MPIDFGLDKKEALLKLNVEAHFKKGSEIDEKNQRLAAEALLHLMAAQECRGDFKREDAAEICLLQYDKKTIHKIAIKFVKDDTTKWADILQLTEKEKPELANSVPVQLCLRMIFKAPDKPVRCEEMHQALATASLGKINYAAKLKAYEWVIHME